MFMPNDRPRLLIWEREELILAGDLVVRNGWRQIPATDPRVIELSALLRRLPLHPVEDRSPDFRNVNSVARKTADIATNRPGHTGRATNSGAPTKRVIAELTAQPELMHQLALSIRDAEGRGDFEPLTAPVPDEEEGAAEGRLLIRRHVAYERDRALRRRKLQEALREGRPLVCEVCGFDFEETYGDRGRGYIECHHIVPLHVGGVGRRRLSDLSLLCANCHRMVHARAPWLTLPELRSLMLSNGGPADAQSGGSVSSERR
jgi:5-methylcytosine-specific restriction protein A